LKCPICNGELEEWTLHNGSKLYHCTGVCSNQFCEHILKAMKKDIKNFACGNCDDLITECNCFDCNGVFCAKCNSFIQISCSDVVSIIEKNEEEKGDKC